jgi:hypothetical protein
MQTQPSNWRDRGLKSSDRTNQRAARHSNGTSAQPDLRRGCRAQRQGFTNEGAGITFSSHGRQSAASSAAQKSTAGALSHTSQIVRIPPSRASGHRPPSIPSTTPPISRSASTPAGSPRGGAGGRRGGRARGGANSGGGSRSRGHRSFWTRKDVAVTQQGGEDTAEATTI